MLDQTMLDKIDAVATLFRKGGLSWT